MIVRIETGELTYLELSRESDQVAMVCKPKMGPPSVQMLDLNTLTDLHAALGMFGAQISPGEPKGDPESPWQLGTRFRFSRGVYKGIDLEIIGMQDDGDEAEYLIRSDSGHVLHTVRRKDLEAGAEVIQ